MCYYQPIPLYTKPSNFSYLPSPPLSGKSVAPCPMRTSTVGPYYPKFESEKLGASNLILSRLVGNLESTELRLDKHK